MIFTNTFQSHLMVYVAFLCLYVSVFVAMTIMWGILPFVSLQLLSVSGIRPYNRGVHTEIWWCYLQTIPWVRYVPTTESASGHEPGVTEGRGHANRRGQCLRFFKTLFFHCFLYTRHQYTIFIPHTIGTLVPLKQQQQQQQQQTIAHIQT